MVKITVIGSTNTDLVAKAVKLPIPGETVIGEQFIIAPGGKGANQAVAIARLGANVTFVTKLGMDDFGDQAIENFKKDNIDTSFIFRTGEAPSGVALIFVDQHGENMIVAVQGANAKLSINDVKKALPAIRSSNALVLQFEVPLDVVDYAVSIAHELQIPIILNPAPGRKVSVNMIRKVTYLTPNETEAEILTDVKVYDESSAKEAGTRLLEWGAKNVVVTMGKKGAMFVSPEQVELVPAFEVNAVDATAAGDAFTGGLAYAVATGKRPIESVRFANAVAALAVTKMGAQPSMPFINEVQEFLSNH